MTPEQVFQLLPEIQCKPFLNHEIHPSIPVWLGLNQARVTACSGLSGTSLFVTEQTREALLLKSTEMLPFLPSIMSILLPSPVSTSFLDILTAPATFYPPLPELLSSGRYQMLSPLGHSPPSHPLYVWENFLKSKSSCSFSHMCMYTPTLELYS